MSNEKGLSLVEVMIALVVLLFVSLALMQTALVSIESNMKNTLRDEAVGIAEGRMSEALGIPFASLLPDGTGASGLSDTAVCPGSFVAGFGGNGVLMQKTLKNSAVVNYCTNRQVVTVGTAKQVSITVSWLWKGDSYTHTVTRIVGSI